jgi:predicted ferric reductase
MLVRSIRFECGEGWRTTLQDRRLVSMRNGHLGGDMSGLIAIVFFCLVALALSFGSVAVYGLGNALGIAAGAMAVVAMSQCLILAARPRLLEPLFGGLDRMYRAHRWLGIAALGLMLAHNQLVPDFERWVRESKIGELPVRRVAGPAPAAARLPSRDAGAA